MRRQSRVFIGTALGLLAFCGVAADNESAEGSNIVVFEDSFERSELGDPWRIIVPSFSIKEGRLVGIEKPERKHNTISRVPLAFRDAVFEFSFRLTDGVGLNLVINDEDYEKAHAGHICRVCISPSRVIISDDRGGSFRKDHFQTYLDGDRTIEEYLLDKRYSLDKRFSKSFDSERWYQARIILKDDQIEVLIDEERIGSFRSPGIGHPTKTDFGFATLGNIIEIDDVRVISMMSE